MTTEDKILIAKFEGYTIGNVGGWVHGDRGQCAYKKDDKGEICEAHKVDRLAYDVSWDALMPVVKKIKDIYEEADDDSDAGFNLIKLGIAAPIKDVCMAVVAFIKWYNENLKTK